MEALAAADAQIADRDTAVAGGTEGFYLVFELPAAQVGLVDKLEDRRGRGGQTGRKCSSEEHSKSPVSVGILH